jgi:hypothetical protein
MTDKQMFWISDANGVHAQVEGAAERDQWTKVHGWAEAGEPGPTDQVHVVNEHPEIGPGLLPYGAVPAWSGLGWMPGPPPGSTVAVGEPPKSSPAPKPAGGGDSKEKVNG